MDTPICRFVRDYIQSDTARLHMPGHKGQAFLGCESADITEINGADELYAPEGIILRSERNAASLFGAGRTLYSAGGSTNAIQAMLFAAFQCRKRTSAPFVLAARNAHKAFVYAAALLGFEVKWLYPEAEYSLCRCIVTPQELKKELQSLPELPFAVYVTSPDYLGGLCDIAGLSAVCKAFGVPLLVDNAHGAYLRFSERDLHPISLGASMCCDSAHKTLPVLTGGAYLHIAQERTADFQSAAEAGMALFGSTSPSYLILQSLDRCNAYLAGECKSKLQICTQRVSVLKQIVADCGFADASMEALKIAIDTRNTNYSGNRLAEHFRTHGIECEFADRDFTVLMFSPQNTETDFGRAAAALKEANPKRTIREAVPPIVQGKSVMPIREAVLHKQEIIKTEEAVGRICGSPTVSCPPAVPVAVSGEEITKEARDLLLYYGIEKISVVR